MYINVQATVAVIHQFETNIHNYTDIHKNTNIHINKYTNVH